MSDPIQHLNVTSDRYIVYHFFNKRFPMYLDRHRAFTKRRAAQSIICSRNFHAGKDGTEIQYIHVVSLQSYIRDIEI